MADDQSSVQTTFEETRRCPKCKQPGEDRKQELAGTGNGALVHYIYCMNERCDWYNTPWLVQVNPDGSVPPPQDHRGKQKVFRQSAEDEELARRIIDSVERDLKLSTQSDKHGEVRNPFQR